MGLLRPFFANFGCFLLINSLYEWRNYRQNHFLVCNIIYTDLTAGTLRISTGQSSYSLQFCQNVDNTALHTELYQSQYGATGLKNWPGLTKYSIPLYKQLCCCIVEKILLLCSCIFSDTRSEGDKTVWWDICIG